MSRFVLAVALLSIAAGAVAQSTVTPLVTCWSDQTVLGQTSGSPDELVTVVFGYTNSATSSVTIPLGASNYFSPEPSDRSQPTIFQPGTVMSAVSVTLKRSEVSQLLWSINGLTATPNLTTDQSCRAVIACLTLAGPLGPVGGTGATGAAGAIGPDGVKGPAGDQGPIGSDGPAGVVGPQGASGPAGPVGATGAAGPTGPDGPAGTIVGPAGSKGPTGDQGASGPLGSPGVQGVPGPTGPKGIIGFTGPAGPAGVAGPKGPSGDTGPQGPAGGAGPNGPSGLFGPAGARGFRGDMGPPGVRGVDGAATFLDIGDVAPRALSSSNSFQLETDATIVLAGAVEFRSSTEAEIVLTVDNGPTPLRVRVRAGTGWNTYPLVGSFHAVAGQHVLGLVVPPGVEQGATSLTVSAIAASGSGRRRAVGSR